MIIDSRSESLPPDISLPDLGRHICARDRGVGADGLIILAPPRNHDSAAAIEIFNADGSEASMCGNAIRCVARLILDSSPASVEPERLQIDTPAGPLVAVAVSRSQGSLAEIKVSMGRPRFALDQIPMLPPSAGTGEAQREHIRSPLVIMGRGEVVGTALWIGNPHFIIFVEDLALSLTALAEEVGPEIETHPRFPERTNVGFARIKVGEIELAVWERGVGLTQACGTGACAAVAAAVKEGRTPQMAEQIVHLPGGSLKIEIGTEAFELMMQGPATEVFRGTIPLGSH